MTKHEHHWRAYGQSDGTVVCDHCNVAADVNELLASAEVVVNAAERFLRGMGMGTAMLHKDLEQAIADYRGEEG